MNEAYLGSADDCRFIDSYLNNVRRLYPGDIITVEDCFSLHSLTTGNATTILDPKLFWTIINETRTDIVDRFDEVLITIDPRRYYFGVLPSTSSGFGGFQSKWSVGYHHLFHAGFVMASNPSKVRDVRVRTIEAARSYLHDCLHHTSFRSYRRYMPRPSRAADAKYSEPKIYREQYGFNFRNSAGVSYSDRSLTERVPHAINLNLLMDGMVAILTEETARRFAQFQNLSEADAAVMAELSGQPADLPEYSHAKKFHGSVVVPSRTFIENWGGQEFFYVAFRSMVNGDLGPLHALFNSKAGGVGSWERVFRRDGFVL